VPADAECLGGRASCGLPDINQGVCPNGWHVATADEWNTLILKMAELLGTNNHYVTPLRAKGFDCWPDATNDFSFNLLPAGQYTYGNYSGVLSGAYMWTGTEEGVVIESPFGWYTEYRGFSYGISNSYYGDKASLDFTRYFSVRCVKDAE
jgi:uncharacterized protein (TIGR02145 family)